MPTGDSSSAIWAAAGVVPPKTMKFQGIEAVKQCLAAGMGVSLLSGAVVGAELKVGKFAALR